MDGGVRLWWRNELTKLRYIARQSNTTGWLLVHGRAQSSTRLFGVCMKIKVGFDRVVLTNAARYVKYMYIVLEY